jgi:hypothetical protein
MALTTRTTRSSADSNCETNNNAFEEDNDDDVFNTEHSSNIIIRQPTRMPLKQRRLSWTVAEDKLSSDDPTKQMLPIKKFVNERFTHRRQSLWSGLFHDVTVTEWSYEAEEEKKTAEETLVCLSCFFSSKHHYTYIVS